ncbi:hypothetical protein MMC11_002523 [Xylographa trunciseda]|nr:hypothetical protein [Xylographa trunciseda]
MLPSSNVSATAAPGTYYTFPLYSGSILAHIILMTAAWVFALPISVMLSIARSRWASSAQLTFISINAIGLLFGTIYNSKTPELYENNVHNKLGWAVTWIMSIQAILGLVRKCGRAEVTTKPSYETTMARYRNVQDLEGIQQYRYSRDSGQGTEPSTPRNSSPSTPQAYDEDREDAPMFGRGNDIEKQPEEKHGWWRINIINHFISNRSLMIAQHRMTTYVYVLYDTTDRLILILGFATLLSGLVIYGGIFKSDSIFGGMAHFVKGGIFFWYGLLTLGRVMGSFADIGWSWNVKPPATVVGARKAAAPTAEFVESFLIFLYGVTNVWLEHLGETGSSWSAGDLEHVSISIMFFGGGLCGMLIESRAIRDLLNSTLASSTTTIPFPSAQWQPPRTYGFSTNPLPAIIILLLGMLMSGHHQSLMVSTKLHAMWGNLFFVAALARGATYMLMYLSPPTSLLPSRPPSEIVVAFCLISGGMLFMSSNTDVVDVLAARDLNAMFVFTVAMGLTALLMAWEVVVLAVKAWAVRREVRAVGGVWRVV